MSDKKYYLFALGNAVVLLQDGLWYRRDKEHHQWIKEQEWMRRYYDAQYDVIEIEYNEENEEVTKRNKIEGFWSLNDDALLNPVEQFKEEEK